MKKEKNRYITPLLTVVEFKAERGYSASDPIKEWTGWSIDQEIYMMVDGNAQNVDGDFAASSFGDQGTVSGIGQGNWLSTGENGWF
jgi:hypothetical protein